MRSITASCAVYAPHAISIMSSKLGAAPSQTAPDQSGGCRRVRCGS